MNHLRDQVLLIEFGNKLKALRLAKGLTIEALAYASEIEIRQVHRVEKGKINPTYTTLNALANGLGISLAELLG